MSAEQLADTPDYDTCDVEIDYDTADRDYLLTLHEEVRQRYGPRPDDPSPAEILEGSRLTELFKK